MPKSSGLLLGVLRRHQAALLKRPGVVGVGLGLMVKNGKRTRDVGLRVLVRSPDVALPEEMEGVPIQAVVVGNVRANGTARVRPLEGGLSFSQAGVGSYGTMGAVVADAAGSAMALTSFHVLAPACALSTSANVYQPATFDGGSEVVGSVARWYFHPGSAGATGIDAAVARIPAEVPINFTIEDYGAITGLASAALGETISKVGRTTNQTFGVVTNLSTTIALAFDFGNKTFFNQVEVTVTSPSTEIAASGDSGAVWVNSSGKVVAVHMAANSAGTIAYANPIHAVRDRLSFTFQSPATAESSRTFRVRAD